MSVGHGRQTSNKGVHTPEAWTFADAAARTGFTPTTGNPGTQPELNSDDLGRWALQLDDLSVWRLTATTPTWVRITLAVDPSALHVDVPGEIAGIAPITVAPGDFVVVEDAGSGNAKGRVTAQAIADLGTAPPLKYVPVFSEADFGTFAANKVDLENKVYVLKNDIALSSGGLNWPAGITATIRSEGRSIYTITYTNASSPLFASVGAGDGRIQDFNVIFNSGTQDIFNVVGDGTGSFAMEWVEITVTDNVKSGLINDFAGIEIINSKIQNSKGELLIKDCDAGISLSAFANAVTTNAALIAYETTEPHALELFNSRILPLAGESALRVSSGTQDAASRILVDHLVTGALGDLFDSPGLDELDPRVFSASNVGRRSSGTFIECNLDGNGLTTNIPAVDAWVLVNATTWVADEANRMSGASDGMLTHTGLEPTRIKMDGNLVLKPTNSNKVLAATYCKIGVEAIATTFINGTNAIVAAGLVAGNTVSFFNTAGILPTELRKDVIYYVIGTTTKQLAYTPGGAAIAFTGDGTPPNSLDRVEFHGSRSPISISAMAAIEIVTQGLAEISTDQKIGQFIRNRTDDIDVVVLDGYSRI